MPNQRKSSKRKVNIWMTDEEKTALLREAKKRGFSTLTDFIKWIAANGLKVILIGLIGAHIMRSPSVWTAAALKQTAKIAWVKAKTLLPK